MREHSEGSDSWLCFHAPEHHEASIKVHHKIPLSPRANFTLYWNGHDQDPIGSLKQFISFNSHPDDWLAALVFYNDHRVYSPPDRVLDAPDPRALAERPFSTPRFVRYEIYHDAPGISALAMARADITISRYAVWSTVASAHNTADVAAEQIGIYFSLETAVSSKFRSSIVDLFDSTVYPVVETSQFLLDEVFSIMTERANA